MSTLSEKIQRSQANQIVKWNEEEPDIQVRGVALDLAFRLEALVLSRGLLQGIESSLVHETIAHEKQRQGRTISRVPWLRCSRLTTSRGRSPLPSDSLQTVRQKLSIETLTFNLPCSTN